MVPYFGDILEDGTVYIPFNTFSSDDPSASVTITDLADADIAVHENGGTTQIATDGATVAIDFDGVTGNHLVTIDTSVSADYNTGADYMVRMEGTTVDGATINAWIGSFSIENRAGAAALRPTTAGRTLDVDADGDLPWNADWDAEVQSEVTDALNAYDPPTNAEMEARTLVAANYATSADLATVDGNVDAILLDTAEIGAAGAGLTAVPWNASWDAEVQSEVTDALNAYDPPTRAELSSDIAGLNDLSAAQVNAEVDTALADIHLDHLLATDYDPASPPGTATALFNEIIENDGGVSRFTANALENASGSGATVAQIQAGLGVHETTIATLASQTSFTLTAGSADDDAYNGFGCYVVDQSTSTQIALGTVDDYTGSTRTVTLAADPGIFTMATGDTVIMLPADLDSDGSGLTAIPWNSSWDAEVQSEVQDAIEANHLDHLLAVDYDPASQPGTATALLNELIESDSGVSRFTVNALENGPSGSGASAAAIADAVWDEAQADHTTAGTMGELATEIASILADTNELQTDDVPGLIAALNDLSAADIRTAIGLASANLDTQLAALPTAAENRAEMDSNSTQLAAIVADTNELQGDDVPGLIAALNDVSVSDILTTQMTESYAADGTAPTLAQALFLIQQQLGDFEISGTTLTVRELDGSTTAATFTLDSSTSPTDITRAT